MDLSGYKLTFSDEFNTSDISIDGKTTKWADIRPEWKFDAASDIGFGRSSFVDPSSGYNPFNVNNGVLTITAVPDKTAYGYPGSWESGLIQSQNSFSQTYGYFEMRADLSDSKGSWDAFWLVPTVPKVSNGQWQELDVVEHYGVYNQGVYSWIHTTDYHANPNEDLQVFSNHPEQLIGFHTYGMSWTKDTIGFYVDGVLMGTKPTPSDMHSPMYLIANLATQSDADQAGTPISMKIDYIRAYSNDPNAPAAPTSDTVHSSAPNYILDANAKNLILDGTGNINGTGNALDNVMTGNAGNNYLDGGLGADTYNGSAGDDTYVFNTSGDKIVGEAMNGGTDTILTSVSIDIRQVAYVENVTMSGTAGLHVTGNSLDNVIIGNSGNNVFTGSAGADKQTGGGGADLFVYYEKPVAANCDTITDFGSDDKIRLNNATFPGLDKNNDGKLDANLFHVGAAVGTGPQILYNASSTGLISYDDDGIGSHAAQPITFVGKGLAFLDASDFLIA